MKLSRLRNLTKRMFAQSLRVDRVRGWVARLRFLYFTKLGPGVQTLNENEQKSATNTISHNLFGLRDLAVNRSSILVRPLSVVESCDKQHAKVLSIGPRTEGELLNLTAHGFQWENIQGLDLISYSPRVALGDMHAMPFADDSWDVIIAGWVLAYSADRYAAAKEIVRVAKDGALVALGVEYNPLSNEEIEEMIGYVPADEERITSVEMLLVFFGDHVDKVYFSHEIIPPRKHLKGSICAIFSIKK